MSQSVKLPEPFYGFIRNEAQTLRRSMPAQLEYLALVGYMVERKGLLSQEQIKSLLNEVPFDLRTPEGKEQKLKDVFDSFDTLPGNEALRDKLKRAGAPVAGMASDGELVKSKP